MGEFEQMTSRLADRAADVAGDSEECAQCQKTSAHLDPDMSVPCVAHVLREEFDVFGGHRVFFARQRPVAGITEEVQLLACRGRSYRYSSDLGSAAGAIEPERQGVHRCIVSRAVVSCHDAAKRDALAVLDA